MDVIAYDVKYLALGSGKEERFVFQKASQKPPFILQGMTLQRGLGETDAEQ